MKPAPFDYYRPGTLDEALALLAQYGGDAKPLAGGQSLIPAMNFRLATPAVLIDLNAIGELAYIDNGNETRAVAVPPPIRIGAMTRQRTLEHSAVIARYAPLVTRTLPFVAHVAIRTRGTVGGSLAHADPAAELPAVMLALNASFTITSHAGSRTLSAGEFFCGLFSTALEPGELLTAITIPAATERRYYAFQEISRRHGDFALAGVAAMVAMDEGNRVSEARIALLSVGDRPLLAASAVSALAGQALTAESIRAAADAAAHQDIDPPGDIHASSRYRRQLVNVLTRRALETVAGECHGVEG